MKWFCKSNTVRDCCFNVASTANSISRCEAFVHFRVYQMSAHRVHSTMIVDPVTLVSSKTVLSFKQDALESYSGLSAF